MLQETNLHKALKAHMNGKEVLVMFTGCADGSGSIMVDKLDDYFAGCRFLVEVPATVNQDFEEAVREMEAKIPPPKTLMERINDLPPARRNRPASVWIPVANGSR